MDNISKGTEFIINNYSKDETLRDYIQNVKDAECDSDLAFAVKNFMRELVRRNDENVNTLCHLFEGFVEAENL